MGRKMIVGCHERKEDMTRNGLPRLAYASLAMTKRKEDMTLPPVIARSDSDEAIQTFLCHSEFIFFCHSELAKQVKNLKRKAEEMFRLKAQHDKERGTLAMTKRKEDMTLPPVIARRSESFP